MNAVYTVAGVILVIASFITAFRLMVGPNTLDRLVALDAVTAIAMGGLAVWAAYSGDATVLPGVVALALIGFVGSTSVARFRVPDDAGRAPRSRRAARSARPIADEERDGGIE